MLQSGDGQPIPPGGRQPLRRDEILRVAARIFRDNGYRATNLQVVADHFGVKRPAIYYWFPSKADILVEIHRRFLGGGHRPPDLVLGSPRAAGGEKGENLTRPGGLFARG